MVVVGLTNLLTEGDVLLQPALVKAWPMVLEAALDLFLLVQDLGTEEDNNLDQLDPEESSFQASFSKLGASEPASRDPLAQIPDAKVYLSSRLAETSRRHPGKVRKGARTRFHDQNISLTSNLCSVQLQELMKPLPEASVQAFMSFMASNSYVSQVIVNGFIC